MIASDMFTGAVSDCPYFIALLPAEGAAAFINAAGRRLIGIDVEQTALPALTDLFVPSDLTFVRDVMLSELERRHLWTGDFRMRDQTTGLPIAMRLHVYHTRSSPADSPTIAIVGEGTLERVRAERRLRALVDAGASLTHSLGTAESFGDLAELMVRTLATLCVIDVFHDLPNGTRRIERVASAHVDRPWQGRGVQFAEFVPPQTHVSHPVARIFSDGSSSLVADIDDAWIANNASSAAHAGIIRALGLRSLIAVPMVAGGEVVGALTCALGSEGVSRVGMPSTYDFEDLFFLEEIGRRAGGAIETARLYARERRIAETLQAASLPRELPSDGVLFVDAEYRPGRAEATIGGDWYDAFVLPDGRYVMTIGDVSGNGLQAAVTMTKLRQAMQSAAMVRASPNVMLDVADRTLRMLSPDTYATALAAIFDPSDYTTAFASAGHAGPDIRTPGGDIVEYDLAGLLLGLRNGAESTVVTVATPPGTVLVFFTDGLTEATRDVDEGLRRLRAAIEVLPADEPHPASAIARTVLRGEEAGDDVAVLTIVVR